MQDEDKQIKDIKCVGHHFTQTTGGKDEPNIVSMRKSCRTSQHGTQNVKTHIRTSPKTKKQKTKKNNNKKDEQHGPHQKPY